jgi:large subunit ribosomal protein L16
VVIQPTRTKFRKHQRRRLNGVAAAGNTVAFGEFGLMAMELGHIKTNQIESARKALTHFLKRGGKVWVRMLADHTYTSRAAESRMGSGKGDPVGFEARVKPGHVIFEIAGVSKLDATEAFRLASFKLPIATRMVEK